MSASQTATASSTATTSGARDHARAQAGQVVDAMPYLPTSTWVSGPDDPTPESLSWAETVAGGGYTHLVLGAGTTVLLRDLEGSACAHVVLFNADQPWERLNVADTIKVQWQSYLHAGQLLLSDQGRVLASITSDTSGRHDVFAGTSTQSWNLTKFGSGVAEGPSPAGRELLKLAAAKHGLEPRDLPPSISLFQGVHVDRNGALLFDGSAGAGATVTLKAELPIVLLLANVPHPLDPRPEYFCSTLEVLAWPGKPTGPGDPIWTATPEAERAYLNTAAYSSLRGAK